MMNKKIKGTALATLAVGAAVGVVSAQQGTVHAAEQTEVVKAQETAAATSPVSSAQAEVDQAAAAKSGAASSAAATAAAKAAASDTPEDFLEVTKNAKQAVYTPTAAELAEKIPDVSQLTDAQVIELSTFVASELNGLRASFGFPPFEVTNGSVAYTQYISNHYDADDFDAREMMMHDIAALYDAQDQFGLPATWSEEVGMGQASRSTTMGSLKAAFVRVINSMLFDDADSSWGHAIGLISSDFKPEQVSHAYIGVSADKYAALHFNGIESRDFVDHDPFYMVPDDYITTSYTVPVTSSSANQAKLTQLQDTLKQQQATLTAAKQNLTTAQNKQKQAQSAEKTAEQNLASAQQQQQAAATQLTQAKQAVIDAQSQLAAAQKNLADATKANENAVVTAAERKAALATAQTAKKDADEQLAALKKDADTAASAATKAQDQLDSTQQQLTADQDSLSQAQLTLATAKARLDALTNADSNLSAVIAAFAAAQASVKSAKSALLTANNNNDAAQIALFLATQKLALAQAKLSRAQQQAAQHDAAVAAVDSVQLPRKGSNTQAKASLQAAKPLSATAMGVRSTRAAAESKSAELAQLGDTDSEVTVWGALMLATGALLGLVGTTRRKRNF